MGTPGYQHPLRDFSFYNKSIDDYPIALISASLAALGCDPGLYERFNRSDIIIVHPEEIANRGSEAYGRMKRVLAQRGKLGHYRLSLMLESPSPSLPGIEGVIRRIARPRSDSCDSAGLFIHDGRCGYRDESTGETIIEPVFENATDFREGTALVTIEGRPKTINNDGTFLFDGLDYQDIKPLREGIAAFCVEGRWGFAGMDGRVVVEPRFEAAGTVHEGFAAVKKNGKWAYMDKEGNYLTGFLFDRALGFRRGTAVGYIGKEIMKIDSAGNIKGL